MFTPLRLLLEECDSLSATGVRYSEFSGSDLLISADGRNNMAAEMRDFSDGDFMGEGAEEIVTGQFGQENVQSRYLGSAEIP